jgi:hypothetical protein
MPKPQITTLTPFSEFPPSPVRREMRDIRYMECQVTEHTRANFSLASIAWFGQKLSPMKNRGEI